MSNKLRLLRTQIRTKGAEVLSQSMAFQKSYNELSALLKQYDSVSDDYADIQEINELNRKLIEIDEENQRLKSELSLAKSLIKSSSKTVSGSSPKTGGKSRFDVVGTVDHVNRNHVAVEGMNGHVNGAADVKEEVEVESSRRKRTATPKGLDYNDTKRRRSSDSDSTNKSKSTKTDSTNTSKSTTTDSTDKSKSTKTDSTDKSKSTKTHRGTPIVQWKTPRRQQPKATLHTPKLTSPRVSKVTSSSVAKTTSATEMVMTSRPPPSMGRRGRGAGRHSTCVDVKKEILEPGAETVVKNGLAANGMSTNGMMKTMPTTLAVSNSSSWANIVAAQIAEDATGKSNHRRNNETVHRCYMCSYPPFKRPSDLVRHIKLKHGNDFVSV